MLLKISFAINLVFAAALIGLVTVLTNKVAVLDDKLSALQEHTTSQSAVESRSPVEQTEYLLTSKQDLLELIREANAASRAQNAQLGSVPELAAQVETDLAHQMDVDDARMAAQSSLQNLIALGEVKPDDLAEFYLSIAKLEENQQKQFYKRLADAVTTGQVNIAH